jgi:hypothetical protein
MMYNRMSGRPQSNISVVLSSQEVARQAVEAVEGAPLFNQKIKVQPYRDHEVSCETDVRSGWLATDDPDLRNVKVRKFLTTRPWNGKYGLCCLFAFLDPSSI